MTGTGVRVCRAAAVATLAMSLVAATPPPASAAERSRPALPAERSRPAVPAERSQWAVPVEPLGVSVAKVVGSGCPAGSVSVAVAPDNATFSVTYHDYRARVGGGAPSMAMRQNCRLTLSLILPDGFTFGITEVEHAGQARLAAGATGVFRVNHTCPPITVAIAHSRSVAGPLDGGWSTTETVDLPSVGATQCGVLPTTIEIGTELRVVAGTSDPEITPSEFSATAPDAGPTSVYRLLWLRCEDPNARGC